MKRIKLQRLSLKNFKGFSFELQPNGEDISVFGRNATGKTTLADAFSWLLFDKDSLGRSGFEIKNINASGQTESGLDHIVEAVLEVNERETTLKKIYREVWSKKRGNPMAEFSGNTTDYYINDVPVPKKEYTAWVSEMADDETRFRLLTTPSAFPALHWTKQRQILMDVCGDISDTDVIDSDSKLAPLTEILKKFAGSKKPFEDLKAVTTARKAEINKELTMIPVRIDEVKRNMPDITGLDRKTLTKEVGQLETEINNAKLRLQGIDNGSNIAELSKKLAGIDAEIAKIERDHYNQTQKEITKLNAKINDITEARAVHERKIKNLSDQITEKRNSLPRIETKLEDLRAQWAEVDAETFQDSTETVCPACGQDLPSDRVESAREKAMAQFNRKKAERLTEVEQKGKELAEQKNLILADIDKLQAEIVELPAFETIYNLDDLTAERDSLKRIAEDYGHIGMPRSAEWNQLQTDKGYVTAKIEIAKNSVSVDKEAAQKEINELSEKLRSANTDLDKFTRRESGNSRIEELKNSEKTLATEFERLESELYLCEEFIKTKVRLLTEKINGKFDFVRFKLFDVLVNGGITECCEIMVNGIGYNSNLNSAARINAGLDCCKTLSRHYGLMAPIFVDNAETVCDLIPMDTQMVRLVVSEADPVLRIEMNHGRKAA